MKKISLTHYKKLIPKGKITMIKVLLIDDHVSVAQGTKALLEQDTNYEVTINSSINHIFNLVQEIDFDIYLIDLHMPELNGIEISKKILEDNPQAKVIIYTGFEIDLHFNLITKTRISGFISKTASREQIINTIECVLRGETIIPLDLFWQLRRSTYKYEPANTKDQSLRDITLSEREQDILLAVSKGYTNREISDRLLISQRSVEYALTGVFSKLEVKSRTEALMKAKKFKLLSFIDV